MGYLLDTDICVFFLQGKYRISDKIREVGVENCHISEITIAELKYGAEKNTKVETRLKEVDKMEYLFTVIPIYGSLDVYAKERVRLQKTGSLIPDFDLLIGTAAIVNDLVLVTGNEKHLNRLNGIQIENWCKPSFNKFL